METPPPIRRYLASAILVVVACAHIYHHRTLNRSAWGAGCGFGMFSTVEHHGTRHVRCTVETDEGTKTLALPAKLSLRVRALPTEKNLHQLAQVALAEAQRRWPTTAAVRIEVWRTVFDAQDNTLSLERFDNPVTLAVGAESQIASQRHLAPNAIAKGRVR